MTADPEFLYLTTTGRRTGSPREIEIWFTGAIKAHLLAFFLVNESVILVGYWWAGLMTAEVLRLAVLLALPALLGVAAGVALFSRIDAARFRQIVFGVLFLSGVVLVLRG